ncbi:BglG family transcription antiterminator [Absicoccus porci]|jgi:mannitol operon transcriptional antiterminator|uniref:BglG family transcription antiterminator n=1 Tax=Absicoccus porci TaxID=2486576 RepID=UPI003D8D6B53
MNERMIEIIKLLTEKNLSVSQLAEQFHVSSRTIRNDLHTINDWLAEKGLELLDVQRGGHIDKAQDFSEAVNILDDMSLMTYHLSKNERKQLASALLITTPGYITLSQIAEYLMVSRVTIINDLDGIKKFISNGHLEVISQPNRGLRVEGKESTKRLFLMKLVDDDRGNNVISKYLPIQAGNRIVIRKILLEQEVNHNNYFNDYSFERVLLYLGIMINRNLQGEYIEVQEHGDNGKYLMAQDILKYITQYCSINTTQDEVLFLSHFLSTLRYTKQEDCDVDVLKIQMMTRRFIDAISQELETDFSNDYEFYENLSNHLESVFQSDASAFPESAVIQQVLDDNLEVVAAVNKSLCTITNHLNRELRQIEVGYIVVHVCAAIERRKNKEVAFHVIVVCHAGVGTSRLLLERLKQHFNFQVVDIMSSHEVSRLNPDQADLVISTVELKDCPIESIVVSPLLGDEDYIRVGNKVDVLRNSRRLPSRMETHKLTAKGLMEKLVPTIHEITPEHEEELTYRIQKIVRNYFNQTIDPEEDIFSPYLHHLLPPSHIQLDVHCKDWKDAVYKSALPLLKWGYIEERYIDAMIHNIEENGPYVVISKGFAIPHEGLDMGSIKVGMNLIRLDPPVNFDADEDDPIHYVCCLSAVDHKTHLKAFFNLVNMLKDSSFKKQLDRSNTPEEIEKVIEQYEMTL